MSKIKVLTNIFKANEELGSANREKFREKGIFAINLMSSPGSGKTSILESLIRKMKDDFNIAVIEGDIYTAKDAERIDALGVQTIQINTQGACHLDSSMIKEALDELDLEPVDLLIIENVGNLVCPAEFEVGEDVKISVLSIPEGSDKPSKYPLMFEKSSAIILNKIDLLQFTNFNKEEFYSDINSLNANVKVFETSCIRNEGIDEICKWVRERIEDKKHFYDIYKA
ncbi:hydrogenase nickel incorporation protein HypB [Clostridium sp. 'White wine YQ']|uniref:hydrogenase nickel incorporation protein HypB n=1 Tax=Clostridium sp. 'White wine YQ' TaxID=3027474 RepID=UPI00236668B9|nr:hydrogenase nickel incorporation protein HypB [Clostridium sp. 'White wine YQ']MDD7793552.1 hydrogenase nickel incorporation protein HypB [Clostridium sp. 'White wine YQ']